MYRLPVFCAYWAEQWPMWFAYWSEWEEAERRKIKQDMKWQNIRAAVTGAQGAGFTPTITLENQRRTV